MTSPGSHAKRAEELTASADYLGAIKEYEQHMQERRRNPKRPAEENPSFYNLLIGDLYLRLDDFDKAKDAYERAQKDQVTPDLVNERFLRLGRYLREQSKFEQAIILLQQHRALDPLLFDFEIDQTHKDMVRSEQNAEREKAKEN